MKLKWTRRALEQLAEAQDYIAQQNPAAAGQVGERIAEATRKLMTQPRMGQRGRVAGTREWVIGRTPYFLVYKLEDDELIILRVIHGKQHWP
ncbi:MAG: type II toxin-antitoxin system RelE/ParE family toxin [Wenzhouxiangella sp.]|nr:type II toxin-antitoxin system RelE/ParE family toxin [Wenzhouxiangella sp.]